MKVGIVGAGMAGLSCAGMLDGEGFEVVLFDKGRGPGGRMATRRMDTPLGEASFDHGAQYFTVRNPDFAHTVAEWEREGHVARWPDAGADAWVGVPGMNAVIRKQTSRHDVRFGMHVFGIDKRLEGWFMNFGDDVPAGPFDALILAIPAEQAAALLSLHDFELARTALRARSQPCWTGLFVFSEPLDASDAPIRERGNISWAVRNRTKPGRTGPETWVVQAQPRWSAEHIEQSRDDVSRALLGMLGNALGLALPDPVAATAHRWRFAMASGTGDGALWNPRTKLGACGDWLVGPRVECAWLSGRQMAQRVLEMVDA